MGNIYPIIQIEEVTNPDEFLESKEVVLQYMELLCMLKTTC